jgi:hypothetical protein
VELKDSCSAAESMMIVALADVQELKDSGCAVESMMIVALADVQELKNFGCAVESKIIVGALADGHQLHPSQPICQLVRLHCLQHTLQPGVAYGNFVVPTSS